MNLKIENNKLDKDTVKKLEESIFDDVGEFWVSAGNSAGPEEMLSEDAIFLYGDPSSMQRRKEIYDLGGENGTSRPCISSVSAKAIVFREGVDVEGYKKRFGNYVKKVKQKLDDFYQPGDDSMRDVINAVMIDPAERAVRGWTVNKVDLRLNTRRLTAGMITSMPIVLKDKTREDIRILDEKYPITKAMIECNKTIGSHLEYFDELDKGTLTAEKDLQLRKDILDHGQRMLDAFEKMDKVVPNSPEAAEINKHISNSVETLQRNGLRGLGTVRADIEARVSGIRNGWAIEDLNALSFFKIARENLFSEAYYNTSTGEAKEKPIFRPGEREYLKKLDTAWKKIETKVIRTEAERKALLTEMRELVKEGYEKKFLMTQDSGMQFGLYTFDRILERKLPQEEKDLMGSADLGQMISQFDEEREAAANAPQQEEGPVQQAAAEEARERDNRLYDIRELKNRWFYDELKAEREAATEASGELSRDLSAYSDMLRYIMAEKGLSFMEAVELEKAGDEERKALAKEFFEAYAAHPVMSTDLPQSVVENNAAWYGNKDAKAIKSILSNPIPDFDPRNPEELKATAGQKNELGMMAHFVMDCTQDISNIMSKSVMNSKGEAAYLDAFGGRREYAKMMGQLQVLNQLQDLSVKASSPEYPVHVQALALTYLENIYSNIKGKKPEEIDPSLWHYMRSVTKVISESIEEDKKLPMEGAPSYAAMKDYLEGKGPSPFTEEYLHRNIEVPAKEWMAEEAAEEVRTMFGNYNKREIDLARVYNLDFVDLREVPQKDITAEDIKGFSDAQKKAIHTCFQQLLGPMISSYTFQADLAGLKNEDPMDRYRINGRKISEIVASKYPGLEGKDRETAMETLLLEAMADPQAELSFVAYTYDKALNIVEQKPRIIPKAKPHMEKMSAVKPLNEKEQAEAAYDAIKKGASQLNAFMPGVFRSFGADYLDAHLDRMKELGSDFIIDGLDGEDYIKKEYREQLANDASVLATGLEKQGRLQEAAFVRYQINRNEVLHGLGGKEGNYSFSALNALTDKLNLEAGAKRTPSQVFEGLRNFPIIEAAQTAGEIQKIQNTMRSQSGDELKAAEADNRKLLIEKMNLLETQIRTMRSNIANGNARGQVESAFADPKEVDRFINGCPGSKTMLAELSAKKKALANGWPVRDVDLIASFYVKREMLKTAAESKVPGSVERLKYERGFRAVNEICTHLDAHPISSAQERKDVLNFINSYGTALYNDTVATAGMADKGQLTALKTQMDEAMKAMIDPELFYAPEQQEQFKALLPAGQPAADAEVIYEAYVQPFYQMNPAEHTKPVSDEDYIKAESAKAEKIRAQLQTVKPGAVDEDLPDAKRNKAMQQFAEVQNLRLADIKKQEKGRLYVNTNCELLDDMLDSLDMSKGVDTVFGTLTDEAGMGKTFPLTGAANAALELNSRMRAALKFSEEGKANPDDLNTKLDILNSINALENSINEMRRNAGAMNREQELSKIFTSPDAVKKFVNGEPGSKMMLADLAGRKSAITMGWPVEDTDLIASFYAKRQLLKDAIADKEEGSRERQELETAFGTMDEICRYIDSHPVMNAGDRMAALNFIHNHGSALYNETAANADMPDKGQLYTLKAQMIKAMSHTPQLSSFKNVEQLAALLERAGEIHHDIPEIGFNRGAYSDEYRAVRNAFEAQKREQEMGEALLDLFEKDDAFYKTGNVPSMEDLADKEAKSMEAKQLRIQVPGYFDAQDVLERMGRINTSVTPDMFKKDAPARMMDDLRTYYLGKGSCTYTVTENETDAYGNPVRDEKGVIKTVTTEHSLNFNTYDDVLKLNSLPLDARRQLVDKYMDDLERHPFGPDVDDATAEASARYYADIHKKAMTKFKMSAYEGLDFNGTADIQKLTKGGSKLYSKAVYAQDFMQNTELFSQYSPVYDSKKPNRLRQAYIDEFGSTEEYSKLREPLDVLQGMKMLSTIVMSDKMYSLQHRALAKYYLQEIDKLMKAPGGVRPGTAIDAVSIGSFLLDPMLALPKENIPTDAELKAYIDGNAPSPFKQPYLDKVNEKLREHRATEAGKESAAHRETIEKGNLDTSPVFNLSYIHMPHQARDQRGKLTEVPQTLPDLNALTDAQQKETRQTFDRVLGHLTGSSRYGKQYDYCMRRGEPLTDRFRIDGKKPLEYLAANGYPAIAQNPDKKYLDTVIKATIMTAMADPAKKLSFVPYMMDKNGNMVEDKPIPLDAKPAYAERIKNNARIRVSNPENEGGKYYAALFKLRCQFPAIVSFDPSVNYRTLMTDEKAREAVKDETNGMVASGIIKNLFYDEDRDEVPFEDIDRLRAWSTITAKEQPIQYNYLVGTKADGSLNEEGKKNLAAVKDFFKRSKEKLYETADRWEKINPVYADYMRVYADYLRTEDDGLTWMDMELNNNLFMIVYGQLGGLGAVDADKIDANSPDFTNDLILACIGYPAGSPALELPQAAFAAKRSAIIMSEHERMKKDGTLSNTDDRMLRKMMISEMDELEKRLRRIDDVAFKSRIPGTPEEEYARKMRDNSEHPRYLHNELYEVSSHFPRGSGEAWTDMEGKRAMLANGWPIEDINLLSTIYVQRRLLKHTIESKKDKNDRQWLDERNRSLKVMDDIIKKLEETPITGPADRQRMFEYMEGYGEAFYSPDIAGGDLNEVEELRERMNKAKSRKPAPEEFLSAQELTEARAEYQRYQARKNSANPDAPTVGGPQTDIERAFLNTERVGALMTMRGRLLKEGLSSDAVHGKTLRDLDSYISQINDFYSNTDYLNPANAEQRKAAFDKLVKDSQELVQQVGRSVDKLDNGTGKKLSDKEQRIYDSFAEMQYQLRHMRSAHTAYVDFETKRRLELQKAEQEAERKRQEAERMQQEKEYVNNYLKDHLAIVINGRRYMNRDYLFARYAGNKAELEDIYKENIPVALEVLEIDGKLVAKDIITERQRLHDERVQTQKAAQEKVTAERGKRRDGKPSEDLYADGVTDLFENERKRIMEERRADMDVAEKQKKGKVQRINRINDDDDLMKRSVKQIAELDYDSMAKAKTAYEEIKADTSPEMIQKIVKRGIEYTTAMNRYNRVVRTVTATMSNEELLERIRTKWPDWYQENLARAVQTLTNPADIRAKINVRLTDSLTPEECHGFLKEISDRLYHDDKQRLKKEMLETKTLTELELDEQVSHILHDRVEELREGLKTDDTLNENEKREYLEALEYADEFVTLADPHVKDEYFSHRRIQEEVAGDSSKKDLADGFNEIEDIELKQVVNDLMSNAEDFVANGISPVLEDGFEKMMDLKLGLGENNLNSFATMLTMMEEMGMQMSNDFPGGTVESRGFAEVSRTRYELIDAVNNGDRQAIINAKRNYEKARADMDKLFAFADDEKNFSKYSVAGNIDATRQLNVPLEYAKDYYNNSKINSVHLLFSALKWSGVSIQQFKEDPNAFIETVVRKNLEMCDPEIRLRNKSAGQILGEFGNEDDFERGAFQSEVMGIQANLTRIEEALTMMDDDPERRKKNYTNYKIRDQFRANVLLHHVNNNPYRNKERKNEVQQLLSIVDMADLENNRGRMLTNKPLDANGRPVPKITAADYVAGLGPHYNGYSALSTRADEILRDARNIAGKKFGAVSFMMNRQAALSMLLVKRAADRGKPGFDLLEDEIMNAAQYYDQIRAAHPEYALPALSDEQRKTFEENAKQFKTQMNAAESKLTVEQKHAIEERKNANSVAERHTAQHVTELNNELKREEERFVNSYNLLETERKEAAAEHNNAHVSFMVDQKRVLVSNMRSWLIEQTKAGNVTTDYARKRISEILALKDTDSAKMPEYGLQDKSGKNTHAGRLQEAKEIKELTTRPYEHDERKIRELLELEKNEDPFEKLERLQQEREERMQQAQQELARRQEENARQINLRNENLARVLPEELTQRLIQRFNERQDTIAVSETMRTDKTDLSEPEAYRTARINENDAEDRYRYLYEEIKKSISADTLLNVLTDTLGANEAAALFTKLKNSVPDSSLLGRLTSEDREHYFAAVVASLPEEERDRLIDLDNAYKPIRSYDFSSMPDDSLENALEFESQVDHPQAGRVREMLKEAGDDWKKMSGGGTQEELDEFRNVLYEANGLITKAKPAVKNADLELMTVDTKRYNAVIDLDHKKGSEKEENSFMQDLYETRKGITVTKEDRAEDVRRTSKVNPVLDPRYVQNVAAILKKMEEMKLFKPNSPAEETSKIYSFHRVADAQKAVAEALKADMSVEANRKKLSTAVDEMKNIQRETDELMRMAKNSFSGKDYMDNLDNVRQDGIPWRYARDRVSASQLNAVWQFGNMLKANNISVDEFAAHPDEMIEKMKTTAISEGTSLKALGKGKSIGEMTAYAANGYYNGVITSKNSNLVGKYLRSIGGIIEAEPEVYDPARKSQNRYLFRQNIYGYVSQFGVTALNNVMHTKDAFKGKDKDSIDALKAVVTMPENEFDPDVILVKVPYNADFSYRKPFNYAEYLKSKAGNAAAGAEDPFLTAQEGRLEKILKDAAKAQIRMEAAADNTSTDPGISSMSFDPNVYEPFRLVQARQQALMELLILKQTQPQYQETQQVKNLENELLNMAERYEALRKDNPELNMPELTAEQKKQLETTKKNYLELKNNSEKLMDKLEDQIAKKVKKDEKTFVDEMKELNEKIRKVNERIGRRDVKIAAADEKMHRARLSLDDIMGLEAYEERRPLVQEKSALLKERELLEKQLESLRVSRMRSISEQYKDGKLPKKYAEERLKQLDEGRDNERLPELFGDPAHNAADKKSRSSFLRDNLLNLRGANINLKAAKTDDPEKWRQWNHLFRTEDVFEVIDNNAVAPAQERKRSIKFDQMLKDEKNANKDERKGRKSVNIKNNEPEIKPDEKKRLSLQPGNKK
ncbi:MAG: hypothetical protein K6B44_08765 [Lachnospiraceae bacterium]|nr:hypothetical protein [Lachnospiraceae bacterium]